MKKTRVRTVGINPPHSLGKSREACEAKAKFLSECNSQSSQIYFKNGNQNKNMVAILLK